MTIAPHADKSDPFYSGQAIYTPLTLLGYDFFTHRINTPFFWRCSRQRIMALYDLHTSTRHLDVGVGTGLFLDSCRFPTDQPSISLFDLNSNCLRTTSRRLA